MAQSQVATHTSHEEALLQVWRDVLGRSDIDVEDDFFKYADYSLVPAVVARIRRSLGVDIPVLDVLESRTVRGLAAVVAARLSAKPGVVTPRPPDAEPVLSFDQQRIWMENQLLPNGVFNNHARRRLIGPLNVSIVERSIRHIVARHETLRSRFPTVAGRPVVVVDNADRNWPLPVVDLTDVDGDRLAAAERVLDGEATIRFELTEGPLFRCVLVKLSDTEHLLGLTMHQIISDSHSIYAFEREMLALYQAGGDAGRANLPALTVQYRDFAVWQRRRLSGEPLERLVGYWRSHLAGAPPVLALPAARRRTPEQGADSERAEHALTEAETVALHELCRAHDVTPFMALLASLTTVLTRWSGQSEVVTGVAFEGRTDSEVDKLIGIFFNLLPMRTDLSGNPTFAELLGRVRRVALDGYEHAEAPIDVVVGDLQVARDPRRTPLFEVVLNVTAPPEIEDGDELAVEWVGISKPRTQYDLFINAQEIDGCLRLTFDFGVERLDPAMMRQLGAHVCALLRKAIDDPTRHIDDYSPGTSDGEPVPTAQPDSQVTPADWAVDRFGLTSADRFAVLSDVPGHLVSALRSAQVAGGSLLTPEPATLADVGSLMTWLQDNAISVLYVTPAMLRALAAQGPGMQLAALRCVFVDNAGEFLGQDVDALRALSPACRCVGLYGVGVDGRPLAVYPVPDDWQAATAPLRVPLGVELPDRPARVLRPGGQSAATGEVGELSFGKRPTGDLARRWLDGSLEYVGRVGESLVVDPMETVATLLDMPGVRDALVLNYDGPDGEAALVGYIATADPNLDGLAVHSFLRTRLPGYLIPKHISVLDQLPRTAAGSYDVAALPEQDEAIGPEVDYVAPRTPIEQTLADMLAELLGMDRVGVHDSFFELGGFSLLATKLTTHIRTTFNLELALRDVFESPTIDELAQLIVRYQGEQSGADELEALLAEIEESEPSGVSPDSAVSEAVAPGRYAQAVARLREAAVFGSDKPDETPETSAAALWYAAAGKPRSVVTASLPLPALTDAQERALDELLARRIAGEPLAYLTGRGSFMGLELLTAAGALIPRHETELLGAAALVLAKHLSDGYGSVSILDLCTGSGNLAVCLAALEPRARVWASDIEDAAVAVTARNVALHDVADRVTVVQGDLFAALDGLSPRPDPFNLVVCNPPYLSPDRARSLPAEIGGHEPTAAFDGGGVGLSVLYRVIAEAPKHLRPGGWLCFELGAGMGRVVDKRLAADGRYGEIRPVADATGTTRAILARTLQ